VGCWVSSTALFLSRIIPSIYIALYLVQSLPTRQKVETLSVGKLYSKNIKTGNTESRSCELFELFCLDHNGMPEKSADYEMLSTQIDK
jgi:hypothetical protein